MGLIQIDKFGFWKGIENFFNEINPANIVNNLISLMIGGIIAIIGILILTGKIGLPLGMIGRFIGGSIIVAIGILGILLGWF